MPKKLPTGGSGPLRSAPHSSGRDALAVGCGGLACGTLAADSRLGLDGLAGPVVVDRGVRRDVLPVTVSCHQRVILMAWWAHGNSRRLTCAAFMGPGLGSAAQLAGAAAGRYLPTGQGLDPGVQQRRLEPTPGASINRVVQCAVVTLPGWNLSAVSVTAAPHRAFWLAG
jgi:hypothetical protein